MDSEESVRAESITSQSYEYPVARYIVAKEAFNSMMERDFPDFTVEQYAAEKAAAEGIDRDNLASRIWSEVTSVPGRLDVTGDGKVDAEDVRAAATRAAERVKEAKRKASALDKEAVAEAVSSAGHGAAEKVKKVAKFDYRSAARESAQKAKEAAHHVDHFRTGGGFKKLGKTVIGLQGVQNRREAAEIKETSEEYVAAAEMMTDARRAQLYEQIEQFGALRLEALNDTLTPFLAILEALKQQNRVKEYELLEGIGIDTQTLEEMGNLEMSVNESLKATALSGGLGLVAVMGTPALVTGAVGALATASTGTAISTLSGAAYTNAVMAWLGGGAVAAGGGGMAAGSVVLAGITAGATAGATLLAAGLLVSTHYSRKLTEAKTYQKEAALAGASLEKAWTVMDGISARVDELSKVTVELRDRTVPLLAELEEFVPVFDPANNEHVGLFNKCGLLVKTMVELAQVPLLGDDGDLTDESLSITVRVEKVLNTEFAQ